MKNIIADLNQLNPAMFKKLSWIRLNHDTPFFHEIDSQWTERFEQALENVKHIRSMGHGSSAPNEFHINIAFMIPESHLDFIQNFYIEGEIKNLFKDCMKHSTQNNIAFHMSSVLPPSWKSPEENSQLSAHVLYEICPRQVKMHASTKEHRQSFDFFQWMLFMENTCSVSAYYDYSHRSRHIQTIYKNYDSSVHEKVVNEAKKYPSFFQNRYDYNLQNKIIHKQGMTDYRGDLFTHHLQEDEFIQHLDFNQAPFQINLF